MKTALRSQRAPARDALVRSGLELLTEQGFGSTGIEEILRRVGVPKGSFYHYFGSKDEFGLVLVSEYNNFYRRKIGAYLQDASLRATDRIKALVEALSKSMEKYSFRRGCLVGNFGQELSATNEEFRVRLEAVLIEWEAMMAACLEDGKTDGSVRRDIDSNEVAAYFWTGWEGAVLRAKLSASRTPLSRFASYFLEMIRTAPTRPGTEA